MVTSNFDSVAPFYDFLVKLTFGQRIWQAQRAHLNEIQKNSSVLVLGGGTGKILNWLPANCNVTYLELSSKMIERANRMGKAEFINEDFRTYLFIKKFDWVICPFFLDCFEEEDLKMVLEKIREVMGHGAGLIITDFQITNWRQKLLTKLMIQFFRWTSNLPTKRLLPIQTLVREGDLNLIKSRSFHNDFIFSDIYENKETF